MSIGQEVVLQLGTMCLLKLGSQKPGELGAISLLHFKTIALKSLRKMFLGCKTGKRLLKNLHIEFMMEKQIEKEFIMLSFLK